MRLDPRAQLAFTIVNEFTNQEEPQNLHHSHPSHEQDRLREEQGRIEALTQALLDPCTTVQEAVLESLVKRSANNAPPSAKKDLPSS